MKHEGNVKVEKAILTVLSSLVKGLFIRMKRLFLDVEGLEFIFQRHIKILESGHEENARQIFNKTIPIISDLVDYLSDIEGEEELLMTEQDKIILQKKKDGTYNVPFASTHIELKSEESANKEEQTPMMLSNEPAQLTNHVALSIEP